jgi:hypothetical protein
VTPTWESCGQPLALEGSSTSVLISWAALQVGIAVALASRPGGSSKLARSVVVVHLDFKFQVAFVDASGAERAAGEFEFVIRHIEPPVFS